MGIKDASSIGRDANDFNFIVAVTLALALIGRRILAQTTSSRARLQQ